MNLSLNKWTTELKKIIKKKRNKYEIRKIMKKIKLTEKNQCWYVFSRGSCSIVRFYCISI